MSVRRPALYINRDPEFDWLIAIEFGRVLDGQPADHLRHVGDSFAYVREEPRGRVVGFGLAGLADFDVDAHPDLWREPHFDAPLLGLRDVPAAAIVLAARARLADEPTTNRLFFSLATNATGEEAVA